MKWGLIHGIVISGALGLALGIGGYTFIYAKGHSYLANDPKACANCHIMQDHFDAWVKSSHRAVAACNDCHTPDSLVPKYISKAENGFWHSLAFTSGDFHEPIQIKRRNLNITEAACRKCHQNMVEDIQGPHRPGEEVSCVRCHRDVGHRH